MIRREIVTAEGAPGWALISQIEHARIAGELADAWRLDALGLDDLIEAVHYAAHRHDDGWADWDRSPGIDKTNGQPIEFDKMRLADSLAIWTSSIELAEAHSPLAAYLVAGHFSRLLRRFDSWRDQPARAALAQEFLERESVAMARWLAAWQAGGPRVRALARIERAVAFVQQFDALSLWLCRAERREPWTVAIAEGGPWTFTPVARNRVTIDPWPLAVDRLELSVTGRTVPRLHYQSTAELLAASDEPFEFSWELASKF